MPAGEHTQKHCNPAGAMLPMRQTIARRLRIAGGKGWQLEGAGLPRRVREREIKRLRKKTSASHCLKEAVPRWAPELTSAYPGGWEYFTCGWTASLSERAELLHRFISQLTNGVSLMSYFLVFDYASQAPLFG